MITIHNPRSPISEAFRGLRTNLQFSHPEEQVNNANTILIASANSGEGKSLVAANLAIVLAQGGHNVLLIDADLHRPKQATIFGLTHEKGLSTLLQPSNVQPWKATNYDSIDVNANIPRSQGAPDVRYPEPTKTRLSVLTSGPIIPIPSEMLGSVQMHNLLARWSSKFDYIIIDSPPLLAVTDALVLSTMVSSVLFVVNMRRTRQKQLDRAIELLRDVNAPIAGIILNRIGREGGYTYYKYTPHKSQLEPSPSDENIVAEPVKNGQEPVRLRAFSQLLQQSSYNRTSQRSAGTDQETLKPQEEV